jgi:hypothetical protein
VRSSIILFAVAITSINCWAGPAGFNSLTRLISRSSDIVVARVDTGVESNTEGDASLSVLRVIKGGLAGGQITIRLAAERNLTPRSVKGVLGVWFLTRHSNLAYEIVPVTSGTTQLEMRILPAALELSTTWRTTRITSILEAITIELANASDARPGSMNLLGEEFLSQAVEGLAKESSELTLRLTQSPVDSVRIAALSGIIRAGELRGLQMIDTLNWTVRKSARLAAAVCSYQNALPEAIAVLESWAKVDRDQVDSTELQRCAAYALRIAHVPASVPAFAQMLDSKDEIVRYEGIAGLAGVANTGKFPGERPLIVNGRVVPREQPVEANARTLEEYPTLETFRKDPQRYLSFWRQWAAAFSMR